MPYDPSDSYKDKGWISYANFLGYEPYWYKLLPFEEARNIARKLEPYHLKMLDELPEV
jgi:hypothetical protein